MQERLEDRHLREVRALIPPQDVKRTLPASDAVAQSVLAARQGIRDVLHGRDPDRLVVVVGPCSLHDRRAAAEYADRLAALRPEVDDALLLVMRTYFEKPRTHIGWKGLINDPDLDGRCDIPRGLNLARELLLAIGERGLPCATEFLDPVTPQYIGDLVAWAAIGARTTESQTHREMASGLSMPVGFKNGTDGTLDGALNALVSAGHPHAFLGIGEDGMTSVVQTAGNPDRHLVLRGGTTGPNHRPDVVARAAEGTRSEHALRGVMVDCSHDNSGKDPTRQGEVCHEVLQQLEDGQQALMGLMIESHLEAGRQNWTPEAPLRHGVSITDACIGWDETRTLLQTAADTVRRNRARKSPATPPGTQVSAA